MGGRQGKPRWCSRDGWVLAVLWSLLLGMLVCLIVALLPFLRLQNEVAQYSSMLAISGTLFHWLRQVHGASIASFHTRFTSNISQPDCIARSTAGVSDIASALSPVSEHIRDALPRLFADLSDTRSNLPGHMIAASQACCHVRENRAASVIGVCSASACTARPGSHRTHNFGLPSTGSWLVLCASLAEHLSCDHCGYACCMWPLYRRCC